MEKDIVNIELYDKTDNSVYAEIDLPRSDYEALLKSAETLGLSFEEVVIGLLENKLYEDSIQWVTPELNEAGEATLEGATPVSMENLKENR